MKQGILLYVFLALMASLMRVHAYELATHGRLTESASERTIAGNQSDLLLELGIDYYPSLDPFGSSYVDFTSSQIRLRKVNSFEEEKGRMSDKNESLTVKGWLMRGAIREDDNIGRRAPNPNDDPYDTDDLILDNRPLHHFYDPRNDRGLTVLGFISLGQKAPDWATTFRALGDRVHLIQDMVQPQHTRNDPHAGSDDYGIS